MQSKWYHFSFALVAVSIAFYFATVSFITSFKFLDFDFYNVSHIPLLWEQLLFLLSCFTTNRILASYRFGTTCWARAPSG